MLSLLFASIGSIIFTLSLSHVAKPNQGHKMLCTDGTVLPCPTFDMLVSSDVGQLYGLTDWQ